MPPRVARPARLGATAFCALVAVCVAVDPRYATGHDEGGISNYGVHAATVVPYTAAFVLVAAGLWASAARSPTRGRAMGMRAGAIALALTLLTTYPYQHGVWLRDLHVAVGGGCVAVLTAGVLGAVWSGSRSAVELAAAAVEVTGAVLALVTIAGAAHLLFVAQALVALGAAVLVTCVEAPGQPARPAREGP